MLGGFTPAPELVITPFSRQKVSNRCSKTEETIPARLMEHPQPALRRDLQMPRMYEKVHREELPRAGPPLPNN